MIALISFFAFILLLALMIAPVAYAQRRKTLREQKNYERGLKMVPLLIHLPPPSDDIEAGGRDVRDVVDENISKAQVIYGIVASTLQKGRKARFYGQRHFAFEIVGIKGFVYFYASVPIGLVEVVKQAIVSAYPATRIEEVAEHNIFNRVGKLTATVGGELNLKESYAYPIATYQDIKRDAMQALLNALSTLDKEDGVGVQILLRPANPEWRKNAQAVAGKKRKGKGGKKSAGQQTWSLLRELGTALVKPPESKDAKGDKHELSGLDQSIVDAIEAKTQQAGYETLIRIVVSSNISQRAQAILHNVVAAFALFDAQGKNGFKFSSAKDVEQLTSDYLLRIFPQTTQKNILNTTELATIFHFPDQSSIPTSQLERQESKQVDGPRNIPDKGLLLGYNVFRGVKKPIRLADKDRRQHLYAVGKTGTGKSVFLENLAFQDMLAGRGFAFIDPHGDTAERLLAMVPKERTEDIVYFAPSDMEHPLGLNFFEHQTADQQDFLIQETLNMLYKLYDPQRQGIIGPRYENLFRNAALTIMADPAGGTFVDIPKLFRDPQYVKQKLQYVKDPNVREFWEKEIPQSQRSNDFGEIVGWFVSKFGAFLSNQMMRNIIGQTTSAFDLREIMDTKKVLLVNLARCGELNAKLLGMILVMKFQVAAMSRSDIPEEERVDFSLYVDEFQNFSTDSFATIMSEARKYRLNLIVANQFTTQLTEEIRGAVFGNVGSTICFRIGQDDFDVMSRYFQPTFDGKDLLHLPNYNTVSKIMVNGVPTQPFSMATIPPLGKPNYELAKALKQLSAAKYGRPRAQVENEIFDRLATKETPAPMPAAPPAATPPAMSVNPFAPSAAPGPAHFGAPAPASSPALPTTPPQPQNGASSFLDEWLQKRAAAPEPNRAGPSQWETGRQGSAEAAGQTLQAVQPPVSAAPMLSSTPSMNATPPFAAAPQFAPNSQRNFSSNELEQAEVNTIAQELKGGLNMPQPSGRPAAPPKLPSAGEIPLQHASGSAHEDTIYIDQEGLLHRRDQQ